MTRKRLCAAIIGGMAVSYLAGYQNGRAVAVRGKTHLRVLYVGHPGTSRERDFVGFLEKHFTKVGKGDLDKVEEKDAEGFDVVIMDYGKLTFKGNDVRMPRVPFDRNFSRPVVTVGAAGGLACEHLGLKTAYF